MSGLEPASASRLAASLGRVRISYEDQCRTLSELTAVPGSVDYRQAVLEISLANEIDPPALVRAGKLRGVPAMMMQTYLCAFLSG